MFANCCSFWGTSHPDLIPGLRAWTPLGGSPPDSLGYSPQMEIPGAATGRHNSSADGPIRMKFSRPTQNRILLPITVNCQNGNWK